MDQAIVTRLYRRAEAARWALSEAVFADALERSWAKAQSADASRAGAPPASYVDGLHLADLALACACAEGNNEAWDHFVLEFRPTLYRAADALDAHGRAREIADSLYAELFGLRERDGERQSLFRYFHGRSSLATWLRAVLSQRFIDRHRVEQRDVPLPDDESPAFIATPATTPDPDRVDDVRTMGEALAAALDDLPAKDRLRLACYYAQDLTLAQIGRLLGEHEATASRQLARTRKAVRGVIEARLRAQGLSPPDIARCFESVASDAGTLDLTQLFRDPDERKESALERSG